VRDKEVIIIGAGPAGLTAAYELLLQTDMRPVIFEATADIGGISRTVNYRGNRIDIGGHRFFSKSRRVMQWWFNILPLQGTPSPDAGAAPLEGDSRWPYGPDPAVDDKVMLARTRVSRILFQRRFFDYPLSLSRRTLSNLGWQRTAAIGLSYLGAKLRPVRKERSLEDFLINRFGRELYRTFFADYTEKVWGLPCAAISPEWGSQRIKSLSVKKAVLDALRNLVVGDASLRDAHTETSLIRRFFYPKFGPGQLWQEVAASIEQMGGQVHLRHRGVGLRTEGNRIVAVRIRNEETGKTITRNSDYVISTMPVKELIASLGDDPPPAVQTVARELAYRDFITVGLLLKQMKVRNEKRTQAPSGMIPDNWIYVQEPDVKVGRLQLFNNWSPYMVRDAHTPWVGLEYFCNAGDELWRMSDSEMTAFAAEELTRLGLIDRGDVLDGTVIRVPCTYPAYFGSYARFPVVRAYTDAIENLFLIGRNGMHRYNNQDHSMLTAMAAVENLAAGRTSKENIWAVNTERQYHEERSRSDAHAVDTHAGYRSDQQSDGLQRGVDQAARIKAGV